MEPKNFIIDLKGHNRPGQLVLPEKVISDIDWFNRNRARTRTVDAIAGIRGIVVHATAGSTSSGALSWWKDPAGSPASAHWIVPGEVEAQHGKAVLACVYEARAANHVRDSKSHPDINGGKGQINNWSLGIEIVNTQDIHNYTDPYSAWQVDMTALIVRYAWGKYPNLRWVFSHASVDPTRRQDPGPQFPWASFRQKVLGGVAGEKSVTVTVPKPASAEQATDARPCCG